MQLYLIPAPSSVVSRNGFTRADAEVVFRDEPTLPREAYRLEIGGSIVVTASSSAGRFYALQTLSQIRFQCGQNLPNLYLEDAPRFAYRAFMIDSCRHFVPVPELKKMISVCAKMKLNVFHWHLTDDQGWRPAIGAFPELVGKGSLRRGNHFGREQDNRIHAGYYTRAQMEEIVSFAHENQMTVVPEIDMPGHASALLHAIPSLSCGGKRVTIKTKPGIFGDILCAGREETYETLFRILDEICEIFPDPYIHLGGDEAPKAQWKQCPDCQAMIRRENLAGEEALQGYFINRVRDYLVIKGKTVVTWNESLNSGILRDDVTVQMWLDPKRRCKNSPNPLIVSDFSHWYADYPYAMTPLKKVYRYDPMINENVVGTDIPIWTEYITTPSHMEYMCFPRFMAAAETAWSMNKPPYRVFRTELSELMPYFGVRHAAPEEDWDPPAGKRLSGTIRHFGTICPNRGVRNFFFHHENKKK